ncbi:DNA replication protein DnaD [Peribacillus loiseleuriae]|uniref:DNA replication protein DnaD n=1 Tax=Peribacillus loiseleuriae TaxID=1679170 RepID=UPI0037FDF9D8
MQGWIKVHRCLMDKPIWLESTPEQKVILVTLLMMANHQGKEWEWQGNRYHAEPGQFITSLDSIVNKSGKGITIQNVRTALKRFEKYEFLTSTSTNKNRLITIVNWAFYQLSEDEPNKQDNKQLTTNKNVRMQEGKKESSPKRVYDENSDSYVIADFFVQKIRANYAEFKTPNMQKWSDDIRKLLEIDGKDKTRVCEIIKAVQGDAFWFKNCLSPSALRKNFAEFEVKFLAKQKASNQNKQNQAPIRYGELELEGY